MVLLSKKHKSLILFIISAIIVLWFLLSLISYLFSASQPKNFQTFDPFFNDEKKDWFNVSQNLTKTNIENRVILLDFWSYNCVNCLKNIPKIRKLEKQFGDNLLVIGVHSGRLENEKDPQSVREAIIKYNIDHPVINDYDLQIWDNFDILSWPSYILISPTGKIEKQWEGNLNYEKISKKITKLIKKHRYILNFDPLPIILEKDKISSHILNFPSKIEHASNLKYRGKRINALIISNSLDNSIIVTNLEGRIIEKIGSGEANLADGNFREANFQYPTGLLYKNDILYVADRGNNAIRKVNFNKRTVETIAGKGDLGEILNEETQALQTNLSSPQDLSFFPDKNNIVISNLGSNQLISYNIKEKTIKPIAGDGNRDLIDGKYPANSLAQPNGVHAKDNKLYFIDSYSSSLRYLDKSGNVKTLIGKSINEFGNINGTKKEALMQNPSGLFAANHDIYVADSYNHLVRKYNYKSRKMSNYSGNGVKADDIGKITSYSEVSDLVKVKNNFYILDSHNNRVVVKNIDNGKTSILDILPKLRVSNDGLVEYLPNLEELENKIVTPKKEIELVLNIQDGWKINDMAPSFFNLVEIEKNKNANLIASYDWNIITGGSIKLPKMSTKKSYYLQGTVYYCEDKQNALCFIHSYESKIIADKKSQVTKIKINL